MKILALEFSSNLRSVAVLQRGTGWPAVLLGSASEPGQRSVNAFGLVERALQEAKLEREQIECIAVGLGPGSYTGIRAAISVAQGWQLARSVKLLGISSADCLAAQAQANAWFGCVTVMFDAQRNEFYLASYNISETGWQEIHPLKLDTLEEVHVRAGAGHLIVGPDVVRWFSDGRHLNPEAARTGHLAAARNDFSPGEELEPIYLRETSFVKAKPPRSVPR